MERYLGNIDSVEYDFTFEKFDNSWYWDGDGTLASACSADYADLFASFDLEWKVVKNKFRCWAVFELDILEFHLASFWPLWSVLNSLNHLLTPSSVLLNNFAHFHAPVSVYHVLLHEHEGSQEHNHTILNLKHVNQEEAQDDGVDGFADEDADGGEYQHHSNSQKIHSNRKPSRHARLHLDRENVLIQQLVITFDELVGKIKRPNSSWTGDCFAEVREQRALGCAGDTDCFSDGWDDFADEAEGEHEDDGEGGADPVDGVYGDREHLN